MRAHSGTRYELRTEAQQRDKAVHLSILRWARDHRFNPHGFYREIELAGLGCWHSSTHQGRRLDDEADASGHIARAASYR